MHYFFTFEKAPSLKCKMRFGLENRMDTCKLKYMRLGLTIFDMTHEFDTHEPNIKLISQNLTRLTK
jgi:hypothetical protein